MNNVKKHYFNYGICILCITMSQSFNYKKKVFGNLCYYVYTHIIYPHTLYQVIANVRNSGHTWSVVEDQMENYAVLSEDPKGLTY